MTKKKVKLPKKLKSFFNECKKYLEQFNQGINSKKIQFYKDNNGNIQYFGSEFDNVYKFFAPPDNVYVYTLFGILSNKHIAGRNFEQSNYILPSYILNNLFFQKNIFLEVKMIPSTQIDHDLQSHKNHKRTLRCNIQLHLSMFIDNFRFLKIKYTRVKDENKLLNAIEKSWILVKNRKKLNKLFDFLKDYSKLFMTSNQIYCFTHSSILRIIKNYDKNIDFSKYKKDIINILENLQPGDYKVSTNKLFKYRFDKNEDHIRMSQKQKMENAKFENSVRINKMFFPLLNKPEIVDIIIRWFEINNIDIETLVSKSNERKIKNLVEQK